MRQWTHTRRFNSDYCKYSGYRTWGTRQRSKDQRKFGCPVVSPKFRSSVVRSTDAAPPTKRSWSRYKMWPRLPVSQRRMPAREQATRSRVRQVRYIRMDSRIRLRKDIKRSWLRACKGGRQDRLRTYSRSRIEDLMRELGSARLKGDQGGLGDQTILDLCEHALSISVHEDLGMMYGYGSQSFDEILDTIQSIKEGDHRTMIAF